MPFENLLNISVQKDWVDWFSASLTPLVALFSLVFSLYTGYRQLRTEEMRLRHELFERRYKQFDAVMKFISSVIVSGEIKDKDDIMFISDMLGIEFIFNEDIKNITKNIRKIALKIKTVNTMGATEQSGERVVELKEDLKKQRALFERETLKYMQLHQPSLLKKLWQDLAALWEKIQKAAE
jgi:hypothetical protein